MKKQIQAALFNLLVFAPLAAFAATPLYVGANGKIWISYQTCDSKNHCSAEFYKSEAKTDFGSNPPVMTYATINNVDTTKGEYAKIASVTLSSLLSGGAINSAKMDGCTVGIGNNAAIITIVNDKMFCIGANTSTK